MQTNAIRFGGIYPIRIEDKRKNPTLLTAEDLHDIATTAANTLEATRAVKLDSFPVCCPQTVIDRVEFAKAGDLDVKYQRAETEEELDEAVRTGKVDIGFKMVDLPEDWFLFVDDEQGRDALAAKRAQEAGLDGVQTMIEALRQGKKIQTKEPITVEINDWYVPQETREMFEFNKVKMDLNVGFRERNYNFNAPPPMVRTID